MLRKNEKEKKKKKQYFSLISVKENIKRHCCKFYGHCFKLSVTALKYSFTAES